MTAVSMTASLTQVGRNVLLIDANFSNSSLYTIFDISNNKGLTDYLSCDMPPAGIVLATDVERLHVIHGGSIETNTADLLAGDNMVELLSYCEQNFDYALIDGPAAFDLADATILAGVAEATLLVVSTDGRSRGGLEAGLKRLRGSRVEIIGSVLTMPS